MARHGGVRSQSNMAAPRPSPTRQPTGSAGGDRSHEGGSRPQTTIDHAIAALSEGERTWGSLGLSQRGELLDRLHLLAIRHAAEWVDAALEIKQLEPASPLAGEEWLSGPYALANAAATLSRSLAALHRGSSPVPAASVGSTPDGRTTIKVLPLGVFDSLLLNGFSAEVWLQHGVSGDQAVAQAGLAQLKPTTTHGVGVVLGAGNILSIAPLDALYELFAHNRVVALKLNPIADRLLPVLQKILAPFIEIGAIQLLLGGPEVGSLLVNHDSVSHVHMTGSAATHDAIVFGAGQAGASRRARNDPLLSKPMTSELGGVSPTIVLPGKWSAADIRYQAEHVVTQRLHNGGYNCVASQVVVLSSTWDQREQFLDALRSAFESAPARPPYYPGSDCRVSAAIADYPAAEQLSGGRVLICGVRPDPQEPLLRTEYFAPVLGVLDLTHDDADFASEAARVVNNDFVGTLGVNVIAHPATIKRMGHQFDAFISELRYGTVAVNTWTGLGFLTAGATWGAYPGHVIDDIQSGTGIVHNALLIDGAERTVVRGPFRPAPRSILTGQWALSPKPPWFVTNTTAATTGRLLTAFAEKKSWLRLPPIVASAIRG